MFTKKLAVVGLIGLLSLSGYVLATQAETNSTDKQDTLNEFNREQALEYSQAVIDRQISNAHFTNSQGKPTQLAQYRGKPLVISMIYTSCFHICPTTTRELGHVVKKARDSLGDDSFQVVTIGFDTANDTADAMRIFAKNQAVRYKNWDFLASDQATIDKLSKDLGFLYFPSPHGFDHLVQSTIIDAEGKVYRQVYGMHISTPHFVEPLKELVFGTPKDNSLFSKISNKIRLFCTVYDPANDRYRFDYSMFAGLISSLLVGGLFLFWLAKEWRKYRRQQL